MKEKINIENWKEIITEIMPFSGHEEEVINFIWSLIDTIENHKNAAKKIEEGAEADNKTIISLKKENEARKDENYWLREEMQKVKEDKERLINEVGNIQSVNNLHSILENEKANTEMYRKLAEDSDRQSKSRRLEIEKLNREVSSLLQEHKRLQVENKSLVNEYTTKLLWANMLIEVLSLIPECITDENVNLEIAKNFITNSKINSRKSGIYEVRFNGATSNVWLRWCENNKCFEAYGTAQKYYDKDMSYVAEQMSYNAEPRPF